ncbi:MULTISPECIES: PstS family phosphate ABC transporter substrate-binding protein [unclassified Candidatus Frackibacter]|uniref:PstS family phosphate ABC transporter substrate-binding protein n=1 Tax=unclassified Candidatus Frackibacter TaxID=2648818 RepID=UPI0007914534|nr:MULTISPECIES: PstS family phosphate ABC transporter substrate-binding protein [unclassified Candidatus Frackibacter]KXS40265.1 MAG: phosphate binding protein [Candidatus Frackibacter sp. T328-2]SDB96692.1 phosphate ABC transporter substrate-binding protein, PhoT family [Candidatus Frackibacter sp. WG11]SEM28185.1 phosphate ABC transporter substrate-binding protein, PhoT family [Candidatus Frackibacter sp. WG12]SFL33067.1 phosphate ABC transporter substrate-binding protein, PhoT family [Candi
MFKKKGIALTLVLFLAVGVVFAATGQADAWWIFGDDKKGDTVSGEVKIDGSSTVYPITAAIAEEFRKPYPDVRVSVGVSGTGGGFEKYVVGETDINDASRRIKPEERKLAEQNGIESIPVTVAYDGISVVVNPENTWAKSMTVDELRKLWQPGSNVETWSDIRPSWPDKKIDLYGPGADSGTFDYFTEAIVGEEGASRTDYTPSENDNVLVQGIAGNKYALGYFGYAYYEENKDKLNVVGIDSGNGPVKPSMETIGNGTYKPLARPLFFYLNQASLKRPAVEKFVKFYLNNAKVIVPQVGYVPLSSSKYQEQLKNIESITQ